MDFDINIIPVHFIPGTFKISELFESIRREVEVLGGVQLVNVAAISHSIDFLPPARRTLEHASRRRARYFRGPSLSCAEWAMALVGRAVALAPDDQRRRKALRQDAHVLAALVHEGEILKRDAVDRILNAGVAFGIVDSAIYEILNSEFMT